MFRNGILVVCVMPGEPTTMSGSTPRSARAADYGGCAGDEPYVVIAGTANTCGDYVVTPGEHTIQRCGSYSVYARRTSNIGQCSLFYAKTSLGFLHGLPDRSYILF